MTRAAFVAVLAAVLVLLTTTRANAGYTHYWKWKKDPDPKVIAACVVDMNRIADAKRGILTDQAGRSGKAAEFTARCPFGDAGETACILFNGIGEGAHETFGFPLAPFAGTPAFSFVKTAWKPYDLAAAACLIAARDHFPADALEISSDGTWDNEWRDAAALYTRVLGRFAHNPLGATASSTAEPPGPTGPPGGRPAPTSASARTRTLVIGVIAITLIVAAYAFSRRK